MCAALRRTLQPQQLNCRAMYTCAASSPTPQLQLRGCRAIECLQRACSIEAHDSSFMQLARLQALQGKYQAALDVLFTALQFSPDSPEVLTTIGLLYLRMGDNMRAFEYLGSSLAHDPRNPKTILAAASVIQVCSPHACQLHGSRGTAASAI